MISTLLSRTSAAVLGLAGLVLLFAADDILPRLVPGLPSGAARLGQLLAAAWLGLAALNWLSSRQLLGGIYGRPVVAANAAHYLIAALSSGDRIVRGDVSSPLVTLWVVFAGLAGAYAWLLLRGPFERDVARHRAAEPADSAPA